MSSTDNIKRAFSETSSTRGMGALATLRYCTTVVCLTIVLWANASDFDMTEGKTIMIMMSLLGATEFGPLAAGWFGEMRQSFRVQGQSDATQQDEG